jgi:DNA-binding GntR family transcriptional regulator
MPSEHWTRALREHEGILNALYRRDGDGLAHILRTHLQNKQDEVERAGFIESETPIAASGRWSRAVGAA